MVKHTAVTEQVSQSQMVIGPTKRSAQGLCAFRPQQQLKPDEQLLQANMPVQ